MCARFAALEGNVTMGPGQNPCFQIIPSVQKAGAEVSAIVLTFEDFNVIVGVFDSAVQCGF